MLNVSLLYLQTSYVLCIIKGVH